jgi:hypothetical protein
MTRAPRAVRIAEALIAVYAAALLLEAFWIAVAPRWSEAARQWSAIHDPGIVFAQVATALTAILVVRWLQQGLRRGWLLAVWWTTVLSVAGAVLLGVGLFRGTVARNFMGAHRAETLAGVVTWLCLAGAAACLWSREARGYFRR